MIDADSPVVRYFIDEENRKLHALSARLGVESEFSTYCTRLGIEPSNSDWLRWELIGKALAKNEPEFTGKKKPSRGRPKRPKNENLDAIRFKDVETLKQMVLDQYNNRVSDVDAIGALTGKHDLFRSGEDGNLRNSVTRGRQQQKALQSDIDELLKSLKEK